MRERDRQFVIGWRVETAEWDRLTHARAAHSPGDDWDRNERGPLDDQLVRGRLQFTYGSEKLYSDAYLAQVLERRRLLSEEKRASHLLGADVAPPDATVAMAGVPAPLPELARWLAFILDRRHFADAPDGASVHFNAREGGLFLTIAKREGTIVLTDTRSPSDLLQLTVAEDAFIIGARTFVHQIASAIAQAVPLALEWESYEPLRHYLDPPAALA